jgi:hypothetical protein
VHKQAEFQVLPLFQLSLHERIGIWNVLRLRGAQGKERRAQGEED